MLLCSVNTGEDVIGEAATERNSFSYNCPPSRLCVAKCGICFVGI
jgi:hypothetical protein